MPPPPFFSIKNSKSNFERGQFAIRAGLGNNYLL